MTIYNLGSINVDHFYQTPHIPAPGETLAATGYAVGLGGKGANQSVAIAKSGGVVRHIGAVGPDSAHWLALLRDYGVPTNAIAESDAPTGHAIITVAADGENAITLFAGANQAIAPDHIETALSDMTAGDWLLMQNETNGQDIAVAMAQKAGAQIAYSAAPFDVDAVKYMIPNIDLLAMNAGEAQAVLDTLNLTDYRDIPVPLVLVTLGSKGAVLVQTGTQSMFETQSISVSSVDTTGAGDTFLG
ncbi:MAG: PfkB family carbohydrate kinase [Pseudomonadota bacterium]